MVILASKSSLDSSNSVYEGIILEGLKEAINDIASIISNSSNSKKDYKSLYVSYREKKLSGRDPSKEAINESDEDLEFKDFLKKLENSTTEEDILALASNYKKYLPHLENYLLRVRNKEFLKELAIIVALLHKIAIDHASLRKNIASNSLLGFSNQFSLLGFLKNNKALLEQLAIKLKMSLDNGVSKLRSTDLFLKMLKDTSILNNKLSELLLSNQILAKNLSQIKDPSLQEKIAKNLSVLQSRISSHINEIMATEKALKIAELSNKALSENKELLLKLASNLESIEKSVLGQKKLLDILFKQSSLNQQLLSSSNLLINNLLSQIKQINASQNRLNETNLQIANSQKLLSEEVTKSRNSLNSTDAVSKHSHGASCSCCTNKSHDHNHDNKNSSHSHSHSHDHNNHSHEAPFIDHTVASWWKNNSSSINSFKRQALNNTDLVSNTSHAHNSGCMCKGCNKESVNQYLSNIDNNNKRTYPSTSPTKIHIDRSLSDAKSYVVQI